MNKALDAVKFLDEHGEPLPYLIFPDTLVENYNDKIIIIENLIHEKLEILPSIKDDTLVLVECPKFIKPMGRAKLKLRYKPTMEKLKALDSPIEFAFRVV